MASGRSGVASRHLQALFSLGTATGLADGDLLERFASRHDAAAEVAFATLVERHGPMVLRVCRDVLRDEHDADDAFQATFLVLVRRAGSIRRRDSVASWLYGVALRVASCARSAASRRRLHERKAAGMATVLGGGRGGDDLGPALHEEVGRLPEKYRAAMVLCYWQGLTHDEAAAHLRWPVGTVRSRLARGRDLLRGRLTRRGLVPLAGLIASGLAPRATSAAVPSALFGTTIRAATRLAAGRAMTVGGVSVSVATLTKGVVTTMFLSKLKVAAIGLVAVAMAASSAGLLVARGSVATVEPASSSVPPVPEQPLRTEAVPPPQPATPPTGEPSSVDQGSAPMVELENRLRKALDRVAWAEKMFPKGYVSRAQLLEARGDVEVLKAQIADRAQSLESLRVDLQEEQERLKGRIETMRKEIQRLGADIELAVSVVATNKKLNQRNPGMVSKEETNRAEAELRVRAAQLDVKQAEVKEVEIRLDQVARRLARVDRAKDQAKEPVPDLPAPPQPPAGQASPDTAPSPPRNQPRPDEPSRSEGGSPSIREIGARLRSAQALLEMGTDLVKTGAISRMEFGRLRGDVDVLKAQLESLEDALQDERELMEAQIEAKRAELRRAESQQAFAVKELERYKHLESNRVGGRQSVEESEVKAEMLGAERDAKRAELKEIEIRLKQMGRRLALIKEMRSQAK